MGGNSFVEISLFTLGFEFTLLENLHDQHVTTSLMKCTWQNRETHAQHVGEASGDFHRLEVSDETDRGL